VAVTVLQPEHKVAKAAKPEKGELGRREPACEAA
jgi:hypothetical protein